MHRWERIIKSGRSDVELPIDHVQFLWAYLTPMIVHPSVFRFFSFMKNQNREIEREREVEREERDKFERIYPRAFPQVDDETPSFHMIPLYLGL